MGGGLYPRLHLAAFGLHLPGLVLAPVARGQGEARNRADRGQGFAAKAQAGDTFQFVQVVDLAGGVARQGQRQVVRRDAMAVVADTQQLDPALLHLDVDTPSTRVQAVLQQLLGHRGRPFDHLAGSDLVGQPRAEQLDAPGFSHCWPPVRGWGWSGPGRSGCGRP